MNLRPYQSEINQTVVSAWNQGHNAVLEVLPTGGGKTVCVSDLVNREPGAVCVIAHRQELVSQISISLARSGIRHKIIGPSKVIKMIVNLHIIEFKRSFYDPQSHIGVAGVDTLIRRGDQLAGWLPAVKLWVIDEAHHLLKTNKWGKAVDMFPNARGLGVTATPMRADGKGLGRHADGLFDTMVIGPTMRDLINQDFLTDYRIFAPVSNLDLSHIDISKATGDYNQNQMRDAVAKSSLIAHNGKSTVVGDVVKHYLRIARGKLGITFVPDMVTGEEIEKEFIASGIPAKLVNAKTPDAERAAVLRQFANREILQLINVDLFGEGFDLPAIEVISMARPTQSYGLYCQMFGRVLRILKGKTHAIVIDHVGNVLKHGLPDSPREWSLDRRDKRSSGIADDSIPVKACPECTSIFERFKKACPFCGHIPTPASRSGPEHVDGSLEELDPQVLAKLRGDIETVNAPPQDQIVDYRRQLQLKNTPKTWELANVKRFAAKLEKQQTALKGLTEVMALWAGYHRHLYQRTDDEIFKLFYLLFGVDWLTAQAITTDDASQLNERLIKSIIKLGEG